MSNQAHLLEAPVRAAAEAIANARAGRRGAPAVTGILDVLPATLFAEVVEDARAALAAGLAEAAPTLRPRGPLSAFDAAALGLDLGAGSILILSRDRNGLAAASQWAVSAGGQVFTPAAAQTLWSACALALVPANSPPSPEPSPANAEPEPRP